MQDFHDRGIFGRNHVNVRAGTGLADALQELQVIFHKLAEPRSRVLREIGTKQLRQVLLALQPARQSVKVVQGGGNFLD